MPLPDRASSIFSCHFIRTLMMSRHAMGVSSALNISLFYLITAVFRVLCCLFILNRRLRFPRSSLFTRPWYSSYKQDKTETNVRWYISTSFISRCQTIGLGLTIHNRVLCWALIFILRLRFPPGSSLTTNSAKLLIHSRHKRKVMTVSHTSYPLFLTFLTDSEVLISAFLPQFFPCY